MKALAVIPCHNEELGIALTIADIRAKAPNMDIWVVDNASTDQTCEVAQNLGVRVLRCPTMGKGFAVRLAFSNINDDYDVIFMTDGDNTYSVDDLDIGIKAIVEEGYDMVVGTRRTEQFQPVSRGHHYRPGHATGNSILSLTFKSLFGVKIDDTLSGWRCLSPGFVRSFAGGSSGFELETELNAHAYLIAGAVKSIEVGYRGRVEGSSSKLHTFKDGFKILRRLFFLFRSERPLPAYTILGAPWLIISVYLIRNVLESYFELKRIPNFPSLIAGVGSFTASILLWTTGMVLSNQRLTRTAIARYQYSLGFKGYRNFQIRE